MLRKRHEPRRTLRFLRDARGPTPTSRVNWRRFGRHWLCGCQECSTQWKRRTSEHDDPRWPYARGANKAFGYLRSCRKQYQNQACRFLAASYTWLWYPFDRDLDRRSLVAFVWSSGLIPLGVADVGLIPCLPQLEAENAELRGIAIALVLEINDLRQRRLVVAEL